MTSCHNHSPTSSCLAVSIIKSIQREDVMLLAQKKETGLSGMQKCDKREHYVSRRDRRLYEDDF